MDDTKRVSILINPRSFRMSIHGRLERVEALARQHDIELCRVSGPCDIEPAIASALRDEARLIVIIGGDGTLQAAVTALAKFDSAKKLPGILMLAGGRTNYTARDLGSHDQLVDTLRLAIETPELLQTTTRNSLKVSQANQPDCHGFFIAGALVDHVIRECHSYRAGGTGPLRQGHLSSAWRVLQLGLLALIGRHSFRAPSLDIDAGELGRVSGPTRLLLLTSLHHRSELVDPYADRGSGPVRLTAIRRGAPGFWRRLHRMLCGRYHAAMSPEQGYLSGCTDEVRIRGLAQLCLDGQELNLDPLEELVIRAGPAFRFLHP
ncbi:MAG: diacylglycerol/lipid kinase family protein [Wenzhouxiangella sp.]